MLSSLHFKVYEYDLKFQNQVIDIDILMQFSNCHIHVYNANFDNFDRKRHVHLLKKIENKEWIECQ